MNQTRITQASIGWLKQTASMHWGSASDTGLIASCFSLALQLRMLEQVSQRHETERNFLQLAINGCEEECRRRRTAPPLRLRYGEPMVA